MTAKIEPRMITLAHKKKLYKQSKTYDDGIAHKFLCWDIGKDVYGVSETDLHDYLTNPSTHSVKVWLMLNNSADFIATMRTFMGDSSYVYDVDKNVLGVLFNDDPSSVWSL